MSFSTSLLAWFLLSIIFHSCEVSHMFFHFQHTLWLIKFFFFLSIISSIHFSWSWGWGKHFYSPKSFNFMCFKCGFTSRKMKDKNSISNHSENFFTMPMEIFFEMWKICRKLGGFLMSSLGVLSDLINFLNFF